MSSHLQPYQSTEFTSSASFSRRSNTVPKKRCRYNFRLLKSRGVVLVLIWNYLIFSYQGLVLGTLVKLFPGIDDFPWRQVAMTVVLQQGLPFLIYPVAGWIADAKVGRYKIIRGSLWLMWIGALLFLGIEIVSYALTHVVNSSYNKSDSIVTAGFQNVLIVFTVLVYIFNAIGIAGFQANMIPFGVDQMEDGSSEQYSAFVHWYYWTRNGSFGWIVTLVIQSINGYCKARENPTIENGGTQLTDYYNLLILLLQVGCVTLAVCLDLLFSNQVLNKDPKVHNPLKKVWAVSKFIVKNDTFVGQRRAITYSYNTIVHRSDFAKKDYGGPFDSDYVEDVKTFWKILVFIFSLGLGGVFVNDAAYYSLPMFVNHLQLPPNITSLPSCTVRHSISLLVYPMVFTLFIPFYEIFVHPFFRKYVPRMKVRVLAGMICMFLSVLGMLIIDAVGHSSNPSVCMLLHSNKYLETLKHLDISMVYVIPLIVLMALGEMLTFISALEFILAQSPFEMRGLLIGVFYAMNGVFDFLLGLLLLIVSLSFQNHKCQLLGGLSCGSWYYVSTLALGLVGVILFFAGAVWYKKRQRGGRRTLINHQTIIESYYETSGEKIY